MIAKRVLKNSTFLSKHLVIRILTVRIGGFGKINFPNERLSPTCTIYFFYFFFQVVGPPCHLLNIVFHNLCKLIYFVTQTSFLFMNGIVI